MGGKVRQAEWQPTGAEWGSDSHYARGLTLVHAQRFAEARVAIEAAIRDENAGSGGKVLLVQILDRLGEHDAALELAGDLLDVGVQSGAIDLAIENALAKLPSARRLIVNSSEEPFDRMVRSMTRAGFAPPQTGRGKDPRTATWTARTYRIEYRRDVELDFRTLEVFGAKVTSGRVVNDILNRAYVITIDYQLHDYLESKSVDELMYGLRGAEWKARDHDYREPVGKLRKHRNKQVAAEAKRVYEVLERARSG